MTTTDTGQRGAIKREFGKKFRAARDAKKLSRAALGLRLGISPKTIQSWEMGRTFIEDLSLIGPIERELGISVSGLIAEATNPQAGAVAAEAPAVYPRRRGRPKAGPVDLAFQLQAVSGPAFPEAERLADAFVAVPQVRPGAAMKDVADLAEADIVGHAVIPSDWVPRGGVLVAYRMAESTLAPIIPLGAQVVVDRRKVDPDKVMNRLVALEIRGKGLRIRRLMVDPATGRTVGMPTAESRRGKVPFRPDSGDRILGRVVGVIAQQE
jgi:transcriptional regulator with XRE-family HTH domain